MDNFFTTYRITYTPKKIPSYEGKRKHVIPSEYKDPISVAFKPHIDIEESGSDCVEEIESYFNKAKEDYPCVAKRLPVEKPVDKSVIKRSQLINARTVYQVEYCNLDEELAYKEWMKKNAVSLPLDIFLPLTTQKSSFRNPVIINSRAYQRDTLPRPKNNLKPNYKVRQILNVTTGISDYTNKIGNLGEEIIKTELHGPVRHDFRD